MLRVRIAKIIKNTCCGDWDGVVQEEDEAADAIIKLILQELPKDRIARKVSIPSNAWIVSVRDEGFNDCLAEIREILLDKKER